jgi:hypothetical protein
VSFNPAATTIVVPIAHNAAAAAARRAGFFISVDRFIRAIRSGRTSRG